MFLGLCSQWLRPLDVVPRAEEPPSLHGSAHLREQLPEIAERMAFVDTLTYLPDDILAKVDRATMASSLEGRVPFLDPEVVRFAWRLPLDWKIRSGTSKWILRRVLARYVPESLTNRPKQGFAVPLDEWLRGPLRGLVEDALSSSSSTLEGLEVAPVRRAWREHVSEIRNNQYLLWSFLMFALWRANLTAEGPVRV
jgi:asparagine synthase (glutamine-hydrolysing)